jgi:hypothetical protein
MLTLAGLLHDVRLHTRGPLVASVAAGAGLLAALLASEEQRHLILPATAIVALGLLFVLEVWLRDGQFPLLDLGAWTVTATVAYAALPLLQHLAAGMEWTLLSDGRLLQHAPTPAEFGGIAWHYVPYLAAFSLTYLTVRGRSGMAGLLVGTPDPSFVACACIVLLLSIVGTSTLELAYGLEGDLYGPDRLRYAAMYRDMPLLARQIRGQLLSWRPLCEVVVVLYLMLRLDKRWAMLLLGCWLALQAALTINAFGARTDMVLSVLIVLMLYHRIRGPVRPGLAVTIGAVVLVAALAYGFARDYLAEIEYAPAETPNLLSASNEFMALYATGYDVAARTAEGSLPHLPVQAYFADLLRLIPQQLLPVAKLDPGDWYLEGLDASDTGVGFMWGLLASAATGFGVAEILLRGALLGIVFGFCHAWCARHAAKWHVVTLYVLMCLWAYYTCRATTFYFLAFLEYRFIVPLLLIVLGSAVVRPLLQRARAA